MEDMTNKEYGCEGETCKSNVTLAFDEVLKGISKTCCPDEALALISRLNSGFVDKVFSSHENRLFARLSLCVLRALTDKGFKARASLLSQEYYNMEDLDGDGKIYGVDWVFDNPPPILASIPKPDNARTVHFEPLR